MPNAEKKLTRLEVVAPHALEFGKKWDYAPAPESTSYVKLAPRHELFINGKWVAPKSGKYFKGTLGIAKLLVLKFD